MASDTQHVKGLAALSDQLAQLQTQTAVKVLRQSVHNATLPATRAMKLAAPVGTVAHRTYRKRLVSPGFLKRSIRAISFVRGGKASALIGVKREAFYGVQFVDRGTSKMSAKPWFQSVFESARSAMEQRLVEQLRAKIAKAIRR